MSIQGPDLTSYSEAEAYFREEHLAMPYVPPSLKGQIEMIMPGVFGTRQDTPSIYDLPSFVEEVLSKDIPNYVLFGFAGHGIATHYMHYYIVSDQIALFFQLEYGKITGDEEAIKDRIDGFFHSIKLFFDALKKADKKNLSKKGQRLVVVESDIHGHAWGWVKETPEKIDPSAWKTDPNHVFLDALREVK